MKLSDCDKTVLTPGEYHLKGTPLFPFVFARWYQFFFSFGIHSKDEAYHISIDTWDFDDDATIKWTAGEDYEALRLAMAEAMKRNSIRGGSVEAELPEASVEVSVTMAELDHCSITVRVHEGSELSLSEFNELLGAAEDEVLKERNM
ncbi:MAG: hypothetical protein ACOX69_11900 [Coriobacteriales bacterium]|jgi:hypothetical protein